MLTLLREMISLLPKTYRQVVELRVYEGLSTRQSADLLHVSRSNVSTRLNRAVQLLQQSIDARIRSGLAQTLQDEGIDFTKCPSIYSVPRRIPSETTPVKKDCDRWRFQTLYWVEGEIPRLQTTEQKGGLPMKLKSWTIGTACLMIVLLLFLLVWDDSDDEVVLKPEAPAAKSDEEEHGGGHHPSKHVRMSDMVKTMAPLLYSESQKRTTKADPQPTAEGIRAAIEDCSEFFEKAVAARNIHVDTMALGGCNGETVLWYAETAEDLQALIDAGADPNVQDYHGETPLHFHGHAQPA